MSGSLKHRKEQLSRAKSALSFSAVKSYALRVRDHTLDFFKKSRENMNNALNWVKLSLGERKLHITNLIKHALRFGGKDYDVKITFAANDSKSPGALGATDGNEIFIYDSLVASNNHDEVVEVCNHEPTHVRDIKEPGTTALDADTVKIGLENYVLPDENYDIYKNDNPVEIIAFETGRTSGKGLAKELTLLDEFHQKKTQNIFMPTFRENAGYSRAA